MKVVEIKNRQQLLAGSNQTAGFGIGTKGGGDAAAHGFDDFDDFDE